MIDMRAARQHRWHEIQAEASGPVVVTLGVMSDVQVRVQDDGSIVIPSDQVADLGFKPGEQLAVSLAPRAHRPSFGILSGRISGPSAESFAEAKAERVTDFEARRPL